MGLEKNSAAALAYFLGPLTGILVLILEEDSYVRFHAVQSIIVFGAILIIQVILQQSIALAFLIPVIFLITVIFWLLLIYKAWQGQEWEVPIAGRLTRRFLSGS